MKRLSKKQIQKGRKIHSETRLKERYNPETNQQKTEIYLGVLAKINRKQFYIAKYMSNSKLVLLVDYNQTLYKVAYSAKHKTILSFLPISEKDYYQMAYINQYNEHLMNNVITKIHRTIKNNKWIHEHRFLHMLYKTRKRIKKTFRRLFSSVVSGINKLIR